MRVKDEVATRLRTASTATLLVNYMTLKSLLISQKCSATTDGWWKCSKAFRGMKSDAFSSSSKHNLASKPTCFRFC